jgi:ABC-type dipeptide/oligopeptide/nickel transport system ATPase component
MGKLLEIRNLKVDFILDKNVITAIEQADFYINQDEVLVLAGESGSGKTITALSITKNLPVNAKIIRGSIVFNGEDLLGMNEKNLVKIRGEKIAYIFQEPTAYLNPVYTVGNQIMETLMLHQQLDKKSAYIQAKELLSLVRLNDPERVLFDYPHQLSGGMNQRVFIAMALACKPVLLIADEPTTSLDVTVEAQILKLLMELKNKMGFSLLFITHNLSIAKRIADRICVMYKGKVVEEGTREAIFNSPEHFHTKELISAYERISKI